MTVLSDYHHFDGVNWDTGPLRNILGFLGVKAPHTGEPISEALLFGLSGGIVAGYFAFEYAGRDPYLHFLTRNSFDPFDAVLQRLQVPIEVKRTTSAVKAATTVEDVLREGQAALVWLDVARLPYNGMADDDGFQFITPVVVFGYDTRGGQVHLADRPQVPVTVTPDVFASARARVAQHRHQLMILGPPDLAQLPVAVLSAIRQCVGSFLDEPPRKPMKGKYGLDAFTRWAELLVATKGATRWAKQFAPGRRMLLGLTSAFHYIYLWPSVPGGSRGMYADFLDEAALLLDTPALRDAAVLYRAVAHEWDRLAVTLLPDDIAPLKVIRELMQRRHDLLISAGGESLAERQEISDRLAQIEEETATAFPLDAAGAAALREALRDQLMQIHRVEKDAVGLLDEISARISVA